MIAVRRDDDQICFHFTGQLGDLQPGITDSYRGIESMEAVLLEKVREMAVDRVDPRFIIDGSPDGYRAHQFHLVLGEQEKLVPEELRRERDALEVEVYKLRDQKAQLPEEEYYQKLETILRKIGRIYEQAG